MNAAHICKKIKCQKALAKNFNKKKFTHHYEATNDEFFSKIQSLGRQQCSGKNAWPQINKINAWMTTAETASFMKWGGLGMVARELPESFNQTFGTQGDKMSIVTPMYVGQTGKKSAKLEKNTYHGAERKSVDVKKIQTIKVPFNGAKGKIVKHNVDVYLGQFKNVDYIFFYNERFFSINPHADNSPAQDGCYVLNEHGINEVERFAFFSKSIYCLLKKLMEQKGEVANVIIANDWHSGALSGLTKYLTRAQASSEEMSQDLASKISQVPIIHVAHHLGYQGWDYPNTANILNSLYENCAYSVFKNAKPIKNTNRRAQNTLIVHDCYNQCSSNLHLADRVVTVSRNYMEEVSKELDFGWDFRDILKIRKNHRNFFGIVNGYDKNLISPNLEKIEKLNKYFAPFEFAFYDENKLDKKLENKKEFIKLLSKIASDDSFKDKVIPLVDIYKFEDISSLQKDIENIPVFCATSRLVEQKGYDIAALAIVKLIEKFEGQDKHLPIFILGGAGDINYFEYLKKLKDSVSEISQEYGKRIFVFRGYEDSFAYAIQLASDFYMMPCRFEPCGLTQMEAMAKGTLPVAMSTGGLVDTIADSVDGFRTEVFFCGNKKVYGTNTASKRLKNNINAYEDVLKKAIDVFYNDKKKIKEMTYNAMHKDFSWSVEGGSIYKYYQLMKTGDIV